MTLHDVRMITAHWRRNPPLRTLVAIVAQALGVDVAAIGRPPDTSHQLTYDEFSHMMRVTGGRIDGIGQA